MAKIQFRRSTSSSTSSPLSHNQPSPPRAFTNATDTTSKRDVATPPKPSTKLDEATRDATGQPASKHRDMSIVKTDATATTKPKSNNRLKFFPLLSAFQSSSPSTSSSSSSSSSSPVTISPSTSATSSNSSNEEPEAPSSSNSPSEARNKQTDSSNKKDGSKDVGLEKKSKIKFSLTFKSQSAKRASKAASDSSAISATVAQNTTKVDMNTSESPTKSSMSTSAQAPEIDITRIDGEPYIECPLCVLLVRYDSTPDLRTCAHRTCSDCMQRYLKTEINHSRLNITCPICSEPLSQGVIKDTLNDDKFYLKYESFMLRKVLAAEPDARWCPAPDCGYAVLANGCASCPRLTCERDGCNTAFCYHCKQEWHPNQTCSAASYQRNKRSDKILNALNVSELIEESTPSGDSVDGRGQMGDRKSSKASQQNATLRPEDIKECPVCSSRIIKMNDGSCNHMTCSICETEFCWLCMKEISDFHYFSPSGCTFWGKKPWSRKKKFMWRLGMLVGAPICIVFIAGISVPAIVIGIPFWAARKLHARLEKKQFSRYRKNAILTGGVLLSFLVSPIITAMALAVGIPILLGYVYGVVPLSLCRSSGGCLSASPSVEDMQFAQSTQAARRFNAQATDVVSIDTATSHKIGNSSIGETSMYMSNISLEINSIGHVTNVERDDRESASNAALAGSIFSQAVDDCNSTRALAGSIMSKDSGGYTLIPVEIHNHTNQLTPSSSLAPVTSSTISSTNEQPQQPQQQQQQQFLPSDISISEQRISPKV